MNRKLKRVSDEGWIDIFGGVCAGLAYYFGIPTWMVRIATFLLIMSTGAGIVVYIVLWIFIPAWDETPSDYKQLTE